MLLQAFRDSHHYFPRVNWEIGVVEAPVKLLLGDRLVCRVMVRSEVLVRQGVRGRYPLLGVEYKHALKKVDSCPGISLGPSQITSFLVFCRVDFTNGYLIIANLRAYFTEGNTLMHICFIRHQNRKLRIQ